MTSPNVSSTLDGHSMTDKSLTDRLAIAVGTGLGIGLIPWAPGTFGSLLGPRMILGVMALELPLPVVSVIGLIFIVAGFPICTRAANAMGVKDPGAIVYDEIAAFWIVFVPQLARGQTALSLVEIAAGFVFFRIFDIAKPWPASKLEKLPDGAGVMADDLAAGVYAAACTWVLVVLV